MHPLVAPVLLGVAGLDELGHPGWPANGTVSTCPESRSPAERSGPARATRFALVKGPVLVALQGDAKAGAVELVGQVVHGRDVRASAQGVEADQAARDLVEIPAQSHRATSSAAAARAAIPRRARPPQRGSSPSRPSPRRAGGGGASRSP
jgi:hypothetical protein